MPAYAPDPAEAKEPALAEAPADAPAPELAKLAEWAPAEAMSFKKSAALSREPLEENDPELELELELLKAVSNTKRLVQSSSKVVLMTCFKTCSGDGF